MQEWQHRAGDFERLLDRLIRSSLDGAFGEPPTWEQRKRQMKAEQHVTAGLGLGCSRRGGTLPRRLGTGLSAGLSIASCWYHVLVDGIICIFLATSRLDQEMARGPARLRCHLKFGKPPCRSFTHLASRADAELGNVHPRNRQATMYVPNQLCNVALCPRHGLSTISDAVHSERQREEEKVAETGRESEPPPDHLPPATCHPPPHGLSSSTVSYLLPFAKWSPSRHGDMTRY